MNSPCDPKLSRLRSWEETETERAFIINNKREKKKMSHYFAVLFIHSTHWVFSNEWWGACETCFCSQCECVCVQLCIYANDRLEQHQVNGSIHVQKHGIKWSHTSDTLKPALLLSGRETNTVFSHKPTRLTPDVVGQPRRAWSPLGWNWS